MYTQPQTFMLSRRASENFLVLYSTVVESRRWFRTRLRGVSTGGTNTITMPFSKDYGCTEGNWLVVPRA
jgi:hypothetical protein